MEQILNDEDDWVPKPNQKKVAIPLGNTAWPEPVGREARHGLAGEVVSMLEPHTEADSAGILAHFLVAVGNMVGRDAYIPVGGTRHHANLFCMVVGSTGSEREQPRTILFS